MLAARFSRRTFTEISPRFHRQKSVFSRAVASAPRHLGAGSHGAPSGPSPRAAEELKLRGLIFQSRRFLGVRAVCRDYRLRQEFITPYTPQQNGIVPRL